MLKSPKKTASFWPVIGFTLATSACDVAPQPAKPSQPAAAPELVAAPAELADIKDYVARELTRSQRAQRPLLVYVGAAWCEPCRRFHEAVESGALRGELPPVRFLELDYDREREALSGAGYTSKLLPLFSVPNPDGSASARRIEGSIKGESAVQANLVPRLKALLAQP